MILAIAGQKGGTGKSTVAVALAAGFHARGLRVLLIDADPQATARTWGDVAAEAGYSIPTIAAMGPNLAQKDQLPRLAEAYDVAIVDCPGRDGRTQRAALLVADVAVLPSGPSAADAWAMAESVEVVREAQTLNESLQPFILLTRRDKRTVIGAQAREAMAGLEVPVLRAELGTRIAYQEFLAAGMGIRQYAPKDRAAKELEGLTTELLEVFAKISQPVQEVANA